VTPRVKRPAKPRTPWPPTDAKTSQPVTSWDDWWSLGQHFKRGDVWDIIYYNCETYDPDEVNWYLRERFGSRQTSRDGLNYRFGRESGNTTPIVVYIPDDNWLPPGPHQAEAKQLILSVLRDPGAGQVKFKIGTFELRAGDLTLVAQAIATGKITVIHRPSGGHMASYWSGFNRFVIPYYQNASVNDKALIIHEAVHAAMDIRKMPQTMEQAEAIAYIAQAMYLQQHGLNMGNSVVSPSFAVNPANFIGFTGIFSKASSIAADIIAGNDVSDLDLILLAASFRIAPTYRVEPAPVNDGI